MPRTEKKTTEVATTEPRRSLIAKMAEERGVEAGDFYKTVTETMFKGANQSQLMTLLLVADRYHLDVTTKEIYAFPAKGGGIVPVVSIDGWISLAHQHPAYDGEEFRYADSLVTPTGGKSCPEWMEIVIYRKDTSHPTVIREYLEECYRQTDPWKSHTKRMLRHKTMIQGYRVAFGFSGIKDEDEAQRIVNEATAPQPASLPSSSAAKAREALRAAPTSQEAPEAPEEAVDEVSRYRFEDGDVVELDPETGEVLYEGEEEQEPSESEGDEPRATKQQVAAIQAAARNNAWGEEDFAMLLAGYGANHPKELSRAEALEVVRRLMEGPDD